MKRQITIFFLIFLFVKSTHGQENKSNDYEAEGKVDQHAYQDILIEYNFENGEEKWYLKEVGGSHLIPYNNNQNDPYAPKIRTRRHIYMRLLNYNPNLISFSAKFDNKEYASNSALKGDFMDYVKSVNGFESKSNNLPDQEQKVSDIISKGEQIDEELNKTAQLLRTTPIKKEEKSVLAYTFSNISNSSNIVNAIIRTLDEASNIKVVPSDSLLTALQSEITDRQKRLNDQLAGIDSVLKRLNSSVDKLTSKSKNLQMSLLELSLRPDVANIREEGVLLINEYQAKTGSKVSPLTSDFFGYRDKLLEEIKRDSSEIYKRIQDYTNVVEEVVNLKAALVQIKTMIGNPTVSNDRFPRTLLDFIDKYSNVVSSPIIRPLKNRENKTKSLNLMTDEKIKIYRNANCWHTQAV